MSCPRLLILPTLGALLLATSPGVRGQEVVRTHLGAGSGAASGQVASAGDVDADGIGDLLIGAPDGDLGSGATGYARVHSGADGSLLLETVGAQVGDELGAALAGVGDVDGDGHDDVAVGAPGGGYVRLLSGADGSLLLEIQGGSAGDRFGAAISGTSDMDGDGLPDLLVGAPGDDGAGADAGRVVVLSSATGSVLFTAAGQAGDEYGSALDAALPDVLKQDTGPGIIIGAAAGPNGAGYMELRSATDFSLVYRVTGAVAGDHFGTAVALAGDLDGDGVADALVGADPRDAGGAPSAPGYARVLSGADGSPLLALTGALTGTGFGRVVGGVGDVDGDGVPDLAVGSPDADIGGTDTGTLHVYSGADGHLLHQLNGSTAGAHLAASVDHAGDVDGDSLADLAVSLPGDGQAGPGAGAVSVISFTPWDDVANGVAGMLGQPDLLGRGGLLPGTDVQLELTVARPLRATVLVIGSSLTLDTSLGVLVPTPDEVVESLGTDAEGKLIYDDTWPAGLPSGTRIYYQFRVDDDAASGGQALSNTVSATTP